MPMYLMHRPFTRLLCAYPDPDPAISLIFYSSIYSESIP